MDLREGLFVAANNLAGKHNTRFSVVRYGNVIRSKGSVIPHYEKLIENGEKKLPLTDIDMTRFIITLDQGVDFVLLALSQMTGGEIFIPKLPSIKIVDLITAMAGDNNYKIVGIRPGEKLHEVMIPTEESLNCIDMEKYYSVLDICLILLFGETRFLVFVNTLVANIIHNHVVLARYILQENIIFECNH